MIKGSAELSVKELGAGDVNAYDRLRSCLGGGIGNILS